MTCWIFHKWGKWQVVSQGNIVRGCGDPKDVIGLFFQQERECSICGLRQMRVEKKYAAF